MGVMMITLQYGIRCVVTATLVMLGCSSKQQNEVQITKVRFGMLPYGDHTYAIIGANKGWFREAGIDLSYRAVKVEDTVPFLRNGSLDVGSCSPGVILAAYGGGRPVVNFVFGDIFQGYAIMAQPDRGYKSVQDFEKQGMSKPDAIKAAAAQLRGKTFAYPTEAAIKPFIDLVISKGGLSRNDFKSLVLDDPLTVNTMRNHQADFQVGGVPSHIVLEREGFKPLITSNDLASAAKPSPQSEELASVFTDGWACTRQYYDQDRPLILRLSGVNFRIMQFIKGHPEEALAIHMPYLSQVTGQTFTSAEGRVIYNSLDPFFTFAEQKPWYTDPNSPFYYKNLNGAIINSFIKQGVFTASNAPSVSDVSVANEVYKEMEDLKSKAEAHFAKFQAMKADASDTQKNEMKKAHEYYDAFDYYDAERVASEAIRVSEK
jgi:ABC-type nitrate/sulfonate/bicarbonate transport system substrate-binding protein